jgi:hypothetical protein
MLQAGDGPRDIRAAELVVDHGSSETPPWPVSAHRIGSVDAEHRDRAGVRAHSPTTIHNVVVLPARVGPSGVPGFAASTVSRGIDGWTVEAFGEPADCKGAGWN